MSIDGGRVVGGYGTQDGSEAEVLGEGNLLPMAVNLAFDGVFLSEVHIVVVGIDECRLYHRCPIGILTLSFSCIFSLILYLNHITKESRCYTKLTVVES